MLREGLRVCPLNPVLGEGAAAGSAPARCKGLPGPVRTDPLLAPWPAFKSSKRPRSKVSPCVSHCIETDFFLLSFLVVSGFGVAAGSLEPDQGRDNFQIREAPTPIPRVKSTLLSETLGVLKQKEKDCWWKEGWEKWD